MYWGYLTPLGRSLAGRHPKSSVCCCLEDHSVPSGKGIETLAATNCLHLIFHQEGEDSITSTGHSEEAQKREKEVSLSRKQVNIT